MAMRRRHLMGLAAASGLGATLQARAAEALPVLRVRLNADIRSTNPTGNRDQNTDVVLLHCIEGLVAFRENAEVGPLLAEQVEISADGKIYTFHLRQAVSFQNGAKLTAAEVVWSWHRYLDPATQWRGLPDFDGHGSTRILSVAATDPQTVVFTLDQPSALFLVNMARPDYGGSAILHPDSVGADGTWIAPIGTGPFRLGQWRPGQSIELVRFDGYQSLPGPRDGYTGGKQVQVSHVLISIVPDDTAASAALRSGAMDVIWPVGTAIYPDLKTAAGVTTEVTPIMDLYAILLQTRDPLLQDVRIRRALAMALDVPAIVDGATQGLASANVSIVASTSPFYSDVQKQGLKTDPEQAAQLLHAAGYRGDEIVLLSNSQYPIMNDAAVLVQAMAAQIGLNLRIETLDWATQLDRYTNGHYQAMSFGYSARLDPSQMFDTLMGPKATQPRKVWDDPAAQALLVQSMRVADHAKRQALFDELHRRAIDAMPLIPLFNNSEISATRASVRGYKGWPAGNPRFWGVSPA
jgi:peptide/nickel transport system substrate-binding protein